ncbi:MAG: Ig-like domain-containing protein [bacterium]|nr:Ig-like domain-containing protein [bacterium]
MTATGTDNFTVASVAFYYNNTNDTVSPTLIDTDSSDPYTASLDTTALTGGTRYLYTVATDAAGNSTTSTIISVTVDNTLPAISNLNFPEEASTSAELV